MTGFLKGLIDPFRGLGRLFRQPGLLPLAVAPILITIAVFAGMIVSLFFFSGDLMGLIWEKPESGWWAPLYYLVYTLLLIVGGAALLLITLLLSKAIASPFLTKIVRRIREKEEGKAVDGVSGVYADVVYPVWLEIRMMVCLLAIQAGCLVIQLLIPGSSLIVVPIQWGLSAFLIALGFLDYPMEMENKLPGFSGRIEYGRIHLGRTLGFGTSLLFLMMIPFVGLLVLPAAAAGAAIFFIEEARRSSQSPPPTI